MIAIHAKFKGANGSCGYRKGEVYTLLVKGHEIKRAYRKYPHNGYCEYGSVEAFFNNWDVIGQVGSGGYTWEDKKSKELQLK